MDAERSRGKSRARALPDDPDMVSKDQDDRRFRALMAEYGSLRTEIGDTVKLHFQLYTIVLSAIGVSLGYAFANKAYDVFLVIPTISIAFLYRWLWDQGTISALSFYLDVEIERKKLPMLIGYARKSARSDYEKFWVAWQQFWRESRQGNPIPRVHLYTVFSVFTLPVFLSFWRTLAYVETCQPLVWPITALDLNLVLQITLNGVYVSLLAHVFHLSSRLESFYRKKYEEETPTASSEACQKARVL